VGAELFHADRRIFRYDKANSRFLQLWKRAPKMRHFIVTNLYAPHMYGIGPISVSALELPLLA
jgi:hypothetical protein